MEVIKRNGKTIEFDINKIIEAITKANDELAERDLKDVISNEDINIIAKRIQAKCKRRKNPTHVEQIQDMIETELMKLNAYELAKLYIKYRYEHEKVRNANETLINYRKIVDDYLNVSDWRVKENSTVSYSVGGLILSNSGAVTANYWLSQVYDEEIANAHRNADIHIHDLSMLTGYCAGWSLKQLIKEGLGGVTGKITSTPASHLSTLCNQMVNFLGIMQNEWAGAQAFSSFDTYLAPFVKIDNLSYKEVKQCIQSFLFGVNTPSRWGTQAPFTNITLDWTVPNDLAELNCIVGGKEVDFRYKDCKKEMDMINKAFIELMIEGDANGRGFQYPIPTYSITKDFDWSESENNKLLFEMTSKYGTPYFSNYINSDMEPSDVRSMCPLSGDTKILWFSKQKGRFYLSNIKDLYNNNVEEIQLLSKGKLISAKVNKFKISADYKITLSNGAVIKTTANHLNKVLGKDYIPTKNLKIGDYLPVSLQQFSLSDNLSYEQGKFIGAYLGDGSGLNSNQNEIIFSLNKETDYDLISWMSEQAPKLFGKSLVIPESADKCINVRIYSHILKGLIKEFVEGDIANNKALSMKAIAQSIAFRKGILDGYIATDGSHSNTKTKDVIYTSSKAMVDSIIALCSSLGIATDLKVYYNDDRKIIFGDKEYNCQKERYYLGLYTNLKRDSYGNKYKIDNDYIWFSISSIEKLKKGAGGATTNSYCMEILSDDEPIFILGNGIYTHNCRLRLDLRELRKKSGGFFGSGESTGSIGVVTINMPRLAYLAKNEQDFYTRLTKIMDIAARSLKIKRTVVTKFLEDGLYPYTKRYLGTFDNHFSTIGLVGMNEACLNAKWIKKNLIDTRAQEFTKNVLNFMRNKLSDYQELYGDLYNLEASPAESTAFRLAKHDKEKYPDIITAAQTCDETPYYTNSSHLPVGFTEDIFDALDIQDQFQTLYTSGTVFHAFLGEKLPDWKAAANIVRKIAENYELPYYTLSPTYSVCKTHGYLAGEKSKCPICGQPTEVYSRITGYYRPIQNWNDGKTQEYKHRLEYNIGKSIHHHEQIKDIKISDINENKPVVILDKPLLFATQTCPNCKAVSQILDKHNISYTKLYANENEDLVKKYEIKQAPTLVILDDKNNIVHKSVGISEIKKYFNI